MNQQKILMIGGFGFRDIGDESMPRNDIINLRRKIHNLEIVMLTPDVEYTKQYHKEKAVLNIGTGLKNKPVKLMVSVFLLIIDSIMNRLGIKFRLSGKKYDAFYHLSTSDLIFNVGGGNLNTVTGIEIYRKMLIYFISNMLKIPIIVSGQTIGPFENRIVPLILSRLLNKVELITVRDKEYSINQLEKMKVKAPFLSTADDAISLPVLAKDISLKILRKEVGDKWMKKESKLMVALNMSSSIKKFKGKERATNLSKEISLMNDIANILIEKHRAKIIFIPTHYGSPNDDRNIHKIIINRIKNKNFIASIDSELNDIEIKSIMRFVHIAIGVRYHFSVFGLSMSVPTIGIASGDYQMAKLRGIAKIYNTPELFIDKDMEHVDCKYIEKKIDYILSKRSMITKKLNVNTEILTKKYLTSIELTSEILKRN